MITQERFNKVSEIIILLPSYEELLESSDEEAEEGGESVRINKRAKQLLYRKKQRELQRGGRAEKEEGKAWIKEGPEDEPVNFMDRGVVKKVVGEMEKMTRDWRLMIVY